MKVYGYKIQEEGIMIIKNTKKAFRDFVQGDIEIVSLTGTLKLVYNKGSPYMKDSILNVAWFDGGEVVDVICGNCFVCRYQNGYLCSIKNSDVSTIKGMLKH